MQLNAMLYNALCSACTHGCRTYPIDIQHLAGHTITAAGYPPTPPISYSSKAPELLAAESIDLQPDLADSDMGILLSKEVPIEQWLDLTLTLCYI